MLAADTSANTKLYDLICCRYLVSASMPTMSAALQATTAAVKGLATMLLVVLEAMVVTTMVTMPTEETITEATTTAMAALLKATTAMAAMEATLVVVGPFSDIQKIGSVVGSMSQQTQNSTI